MAEIITSKSTVALKEISGYGARCKTVVQELLALCGSLEIVRVNSDTDSAYSVDVSYAGNADWLMRIENSNYTLRLRYLVRGSDGEYFEYDTDYYGYIDGYFLYEAATVEVTTCGPDLCFISFIGYQLDRIATLACLRVTDQFTGAVKIAACIEYTNSKQYYPMEKFFITENGVTVECFLEKSVNGLTMNGLVAAVPVVCYTTSADIPLSGYVVNNALLYYLYEGTARTSFEARLNRFTLDGKSFVTLGQNLCMRTN